MVSGARLMITIQLLSSRLPAPALAVRSGAVAATCAAHRDCPVAQYCDSAGNCYDCDYLGYTKSSCDAFDGNCCSQAFLEKCTRNPGRCAQPCAAATSCADALNSACGESKRDVFKCAQCSGLHQPDLEAAGCTNDMIAQFCSSSSSQPAPPPPPSFFCGSRLITAASGNAIATWLRTGRNWTRCYSTYTGRLDAATFHSQCDGFSTTLVVARNALNYSFGGYVSLVSALHHLTNVDKCTAARTMALTVVRFFAATMAATVLALHGTFFSQSTGSWNKDTCCKVSRNSCCSGQTHPPYYDCYGGHFCDDEVSLSDFVFRLEPGKPQRYLAFEQASKFQHVDASRWPSWGAGPDLALGHGLPGEHGVCNVGNTFGPNQPSDSPVDLCGGSDWGTTMIEVWRPS